MSAICGVFHLDGQTASLDEIDAMSAALAHRGSDGKGTWRGGALGLAHRLHVTTPESVTETQPVVRGESALVLVADARIDNRNDLLAQLDLPSGYRSSDGEIIAAAYERWGKDCVDRLVGDFAFALWDARTEALFCARDSMGVKPFYYFRNDRLFAFASELKGLFSIPYITAEIDPEEIAFFVGWSHEDRTRTMYRDLVRLPAAHAMTVTRDRFVLRQFWSPDSAADVRYATSEDYAEAFRDVFGRAVSARLRSAHSVGATLSGGLDSSSIVCMSRQLHRASTPLHTFSLIFPDLPERELRLIDERCFVDAVVDSGGVSPHFLRGDQLSPLRDVQRILWHLDEPYSAPNLYLHWRMYEAASQSGVRVLLDGFDGDSAVGHGFGRLTALARASQWDTLEAEVLAFSSRHGKAPERALEGYVLPHLGELARRGRYLAWVRSASEVARRFGVSRIKLALTHGLAAATLPSLGALSFATRRKMTAEMSLLRPSLAAVLRRQMTTLEQEERRRGVEGERESHVRGLSQSLYQLTLEMADKSAAAFGVEPRYPFFDRRLIEFCVGLPEEQKFGSGWPRFLFRRAMTGILPPQVQWRSTKANLSPNFHRRFRAVDMNLDAAFNDDVLAPYLRVERLRNIRNRYRSATDQGITNREALMLFRATVLGTWLQQVSDRSHRARSEAGALSSAAA